MRSCMSEMRLLICLRTCSFVSPDLLIWALVIRKSGCPLLTCSPSRTSMPETWPGAGEVTRNRPFSGMTSPCTVALLV